MDFDRNIKKQQQLQSIIFMQNKQQTSHEDNQAALEPINPEDKKRGRPRKYDKNNSPFHLQYFKNNSAALLSANLHFVGNVLRILKKAINNRGFLIYYHSNDKDLYSDMSEIPDVPEELKKIVSNIIQCGPRCVIDNLVELFGIIKNTPGEVGEVTKQLLITKYDGTTPRAIEFTDQRMLDEMIPSFNVGPIEKQQIRLKFEDYLSIVVDIIKSQLQDGADSKYCNLIADIIKENQTDKKASRSSNARLAKDMLSQEPQCRKIRKPN